MQNTFNTFVFLVIFSYNAVSQSYIFTDVKAINALPVISQDRTGTCWSYSTSSFIESEIIRLTGKNIDISEMYQVRKTYPKKAVNYVMRQGKAQFSEGGLAHDVIKSIKNYGLVTQQAYDGLNGLPATHNHAELVAVLEAMVKVYVDNPAKKLSKNWQPAIEAVLDVYLGKAPDEFIFEGKKYTPQTFLEFTGLRPDDYVTITSFSHVPYYQSFVLSIPDNFSNGSMLNLPLDEMMANIDHALEKGYTLALDCDVSEATFSAKTGVAVIPANDEDAKSILTEIKPEKHVTASYRQDEFENFDTQDDHLMHIIGQVKDQKGNVYYKVKNSWGNNKERVANEGYIYMSPSYMRLKAISVLLHKEGLKPDTVKALGM